MKTGTLALVALASSAKLASATVCKKIFFPCTAHLNIHSSDGLMPKHSPAPPTLTMSATMIKRVVSIGLVSTWDHSVVTKDSTSKALSALPHSMGIKSVISSLAALSRYDGLLQLKFNH